ncbi:MAG: phenylpyruvate tautomerase MIF-related protein [Gammaproteobacteria bacterium]|nr:phenylpyruvate tautomerase MIF-related protein [Gammaproteobacteria bacterium]
MPLLSLQTNIQLNTEQQQEFLLLASKTMAEILGKPESYVMVSVQANIAMSFAASTEACAYIEFKV